DALLARAMDEMINLTGGERGVLLLQDENTGELQFRLLRNVELDGARAPISQTIVNDVLTSGEPLLTDDAYKDPRTQDSRTVAQLQLRSVLAAPLQSRGRVIGVVYVDNRFRDGVFTARELNLMRAFANQIAVAIENA